MAYKTMWEIEVRHDGLGKYRHIRGSDKNVVEQKALFQKLQWDEMWQRKLKAERRIQEQHRTADQKAKERERAAKQKAIERECSKHEKIQAAEQKAEERERAAMQKANERERSKLEKVLAAEQKAEERECLLQEKNRLRELTISEKARQKEETQLYNDSRKQKGIDRDTEAKAALEESMNILNHTFKSNYLIDWDKLKDRTKFSELPPKLILPSPPVDKPIPIEPTLVSEKLELKLPAPPKDKPIPTEPTPELIPAKSELQFPSPPDDKPSPIEPTPELVPVKPSPAIRPIPPERSNAKYQFVVGFLDKFFISLEKQKMAKAEKLFQNDLAEYFAQCKRLDELDTDEHLKWEENKRNVEKRNAAIYQDWENSVERTKSENSNCKLQWEEKCALKLKKWEERKRSVEKRNAALHQDWVIAVEKIKAENIERRLQWEKECADEPIKLENRKKRVEKKNAVLRQDWERTVEKTKAENIERRLQWEQKCEQIRIKHDDAMKKWKQRKEKFCKHQKETNDVIDQNWKSYMSKEQGAVTDYCASVLSNSIYPDYFPKKWDVDYKTDIHTLVIEYALPAPEALPTLKEVQYVQSKDDFKEVHLSEKEREALYDNLLYQVALRTIHEQFEADTADALDAVTFNGIVTAIDKTTGHNVTSCVLSVLARKEPFMKINLSDVDPKACFKSLKGVAASRLVGLSPIPPIMMIDKNDRRFVAGYGVADYINKGTNLATMDWADFEHLIRELFEQEFAVGGGEVKVTQASRDGGVDAVAFDPDPIRGGKIVIQAKRYANTVGVSAVRDLYGTVMNEGAIKGLLVTTADYGPDAYEFAKGKPLSLLNGSNLLHLLERHGHQAHINLTEAKLENKQMLMAGITRKRNLPLEQSDGE